MSDRTIRLGMIGAGGHASRNVYPCFPLLRQAEVVANADLSLEKATQLARRHGIPSSYASYREMLEKEKPDGVLICVGPEFHAKTAIELMKLGFPVYTEKPPATSAVQCREVAEAQRETGGLCMTGFKKRFAPAYVKLKGVIASPRFGAPATLQILRTSGHYSNTDDPLSQYILDSGIHVIDLATWLYGPVRRVSAFKGAPANYAINLAFQNGAVGSLSLTDRMSYDRGWEEVSVIGANGVCAQVDNSVEMIAFERDLPFAAHKPEFVAGSSQSLTELGFLGELQAFVDALATGTQPDSDIVSAVHTMEIIVAIEKSVRQNGPVEI